MIGLLVLNTCLKDVNAQQPSLLYIVSKDSPFLEVLSDDIREKVLPSQLSHQGFGCFLEVVVV